MKFWKYAAAGAAVLSIGAAGAYAQYRNSVDEPDYSLVSEDGDIQLREYAPMIVAEVTHTGDRRRALNAGFRRLAAYIFAQDRPGKEIAMTSPVMHGQGEKIAMTSPVMQDGGETSGSWRTRFVMPAEYTMETLPTPPEDVTLVEMPPRKVAAIRFSGRGSSDDLAAREEELRAWIADRDLTIAGPAEFAFYDAPMVPPPLRRNEVIIPVE